MKDTERVSQKRFAGEVLTSEEATEMLTAGGAQVPVRFRNYHCFDNYPIYALEDLRSVQKNDKKNLQK